jgi:hypothetical protein
MDLFIFAFPIRVAALEDHHLNTTFVMMHMIWTNAGQGGSKLGMWWIFESFHTYSTLYTLLHREDTMLRFDGARSHCFGAQSWAWFQAGVPMILIRQFELTTSHRLPTQAV